MQTIFLLETSEDVIDLSRQSSFKKASRVVAYNPRHFNQSSEALMSLFRQEQQKFFVEEIKTFETNVKVRKTSRLVQFYIFLHEGFLCVGERPGSRHAGR